MQRSIIIQTKSGGDSQVLNNGLFSRNPGRQIDVMDAKGGRQGRRPLYTDEQHKVTVSTL